MRCPKCGMSAPFKEDDTINHLYYCKYCHMWFLIVELAWSLPENPEVLYARQRWREMGLEPVLNSEDSEE